MITSSLKKQKTMKYSVFVNFTEKGYSPSQFQYISTKFVFIFPNIRGYLKFIRKCF